MVWWWSEMWFLVNVSPSSEKDYHAVPCFLASLSPPPNRMASFGGQREGRRHGAAAIGVNGGDVTQDKRPHSFIYSGRALGNTYSSSDKSPLLGSLFSSLMALVVT